MLTHMILSYQYETLVRLSSESLTPLVDMAHRRDVRTGSSLRVPNFYHERRVDYRDRNELMMSDLDVREASGTAVLNSEGPTDADDDDKETGGSILNGLLHVLAEEPM